MRQEKKEKGEEEFRIMENEMVSLKKERVA